MVWLVPSLTNSAVKTGLDSVLKMAIFRGLGFRASKATFREFFAMAKPATILIKLLSSAGTGYFYVAKKNPRKTTEKLKFRKYDPVVRKHVEFNEAKIK